MRHVPFGLLVLFLAGSVAGAQTAQKTTRMAINPAFSKLTEGFVKESLALSPVNASYAGYHQYTDPKTGITVEFDAELDDVSAQSFAAQEAFYQAWRTRFQTETPIASLGPQDAPTTV
jgi:hypothetical protein